MRPRAQWTIVSKSAGFPAKGTLGGKLPARWVSLNCLPHLDMGTLKTKEVYALHDHYLTSCYPKGVQVT